MTRPKLTLVGKSQKVTRYVTVCKEIDRSEAAAFEMDHQLKEAGFKVVLRGPTLEVLLDALVNGNTEFATKFALDILAANKPGA